MDERLRAKIEQASKGTPQFGAGRFPAATAGRVLHIDGDYLAYYCSGNDDCEPGRARQNAFGRIETTRQITGSESVVLHLSAAACTKANRYIIATVKPYQGQRTGRKPKNWAYLREVLERYEGPKFRPKLWMTREADDGMAYCAETAAALAARNKRTPEETEELLAAISTRDKDMRMLPGLHLNWTTLELITVPRGVYDVIGSDGLQYGRKWFYLQLLQGDTADNIPGLPKLFGKQCGEATAGKYLAPSHDIESAYDLVQTAYASHYGTSWADRLVEQAALLWLRTDAQAAISNVAEAFPADPHITRALVRLQTRVQEQLTELSKIKSL